MLKRIYVALVLMFALLNTASPQQTPPTTARVPDDILFLFFFKHVVNGEKLGRQTGSDVTGTEFRKIGLTNGEISLLKEIADSSDRELMSFRNNVTGPRIKAEREKKPPTGVDAAADARLKAVGEDMAARRVSTTLRHSGVEFREYFGLSFGVY